jgi:hypothetical protein
VISASPDHEQDLGLGIPTLRRAFDQKPTDLLGAGRTTGLTGSDRRLPGLPQAVDQEAGLGGFAGALAAFERDEPAPAQRFPQTR